MDTNIFLEEFGWEEMERQLSLQFPDWSYSLSEFLGEILEGRGLEALGELGSRMKEMVFLEIGGFRSVFLTVVIVILISAVFAAFKDAFRNPQIAEISFYINYLILIILMLNLFQSTYGEGEQTLRSIEQFMRIFFPTYFMILGTAGGVATGVLYYQIAGVVIYLVELLLAAVLLPLCSAYMLFVIMNGIWGEERLELLLDFWKKTMKLVLKVTLGLLTGASLIQSLIVPLADRLKGETIYKAVEAIPGVGELTGGAIRVWVGSAVLIKNSVGIAGTLFLAVICLVPLLKIGMIGGILKISSAILSIVGDRRMVRCVNHVGDGVMLLLQMVSYGVLFFLVLIGISAFSTNGGI